MRAVLSLPARTTKPRERGITHVLDKGLGLRQIEDLLETSSGLIDIVKFGWGTGYATQNLEAKIAAYREAGVPTCFGGTLLELAILQGRFDEFRRELRRLGMTHAELSTGVIELTPELLDEAARALLDRPLDVPAARVREALDASRAVAGRTGLGGAAPSAVRDMITDCTTKLAAAGRWHADASGRLHAAATALEASARELTANAHERASRASLA